MAKRSTDQQSALRKSLQEMRDRDRRESEERQRFQKQEVARTLREQQQALGRKYGKK